MAFGVHGSYIATAMDLKTSGHRWKKTLVVVLLCGVVLCSLSVSFQDNGIKKAPITPGVLITARNRTNKDQSHTQGEGRLCNKTLPTLIVVGFSKCGTAALSLYLSFHPEITIDPDLTREIKFFNLHYELGFDWYLQELPCTKAGKIVVDRSADYVYNAEVPKRIWGMSPHTKIVIVACEPIKRLISEFSMKVRTHDFRNVSIEEYLLVKGKYPKLNTTWYPIEQSHYSLHTDRWLHAFPLGQIHVVDGERLKSDPYSEMTLLQKFLNIGQFYQETYFEFNEIKGFFCFNPNESKQPMCLGKMKGLQHPDIKPHVKKLLKEYYKPLNDRFYAQMHRQFEW